MTNIMLVNTDQDYLLLLMDQFSVLWLSQHGKLTRGHVLKKKAPLSKFMVGSSAMKRVRGNIDHNYTTTWVKGVKFFRIDGKRAMSETESAMLHKMDKCRTNVYISNQRFFTLFHLMCAEVMSEGWRLPDYFFGLSRQINIGTLGH